MGVGQGVLKSSRNCLELVPHAFLVEFWTMSKISILPLKYLTVQSYCVKSFPNRLKLGTRNVV